MFHNLCEPHDLSFLFALYLVQYALYIVLRFPFIQAITSVSFYFLILFRYSQPETKRRAKIPIQGEILKKYATLKMRSHLRNYLHSRGFYLKCRLGLVQETVR